MLDDPPPGMIWRETHPTFDTLSVHFSGTEPPKTLSWLARGLVVLGVGYEFLFNVLAANGPVEGSVFAMQATPIVLLAVGLALAYKWRLGGPSSSIIEISPAGVRFSRGFWKNALVLAPAQIRELGVSDHRQNYEVVRYDSWGNPDASYWESARWFHVVLVTVTGERRIVACFGERACAVFYARRLSNLVHAGTNV